MKTTTAEKYLDALETAVETHDNESIILLEPFITKLYHRIYSINDTASGEKRDEWEILLQRVKSVVSVLAKKRDDIW